MIRTSKDGKEKIVFNSKIQSPQNVVRASLCLTAEESRKYTQAYIHNQIIGTKSPKQRIKNILKQIKIHSDEVDEWHDEMDEEVLELKDTMEKLLVIADIL